VDGITGGTRDIGNDASLLPDKRINDGRFSGIWTSHDGVLGDILPFRFTPLFREQGKQVVQQIARPGTIDGRNAIRLTQPERVKLGRLVAQFEVIGLVGHDDYRLSRFAKHLCHAHVEIGHPKQHIHHEQDNVRLLNRDFHLLVDLVLQHIV
jgi:hypothetical protein